jgi:hypothetical protein
MTCETCFHFFISNRCNRVQDGDLQWEADLPSGRCLSSDALQLDDSQNVTYGKYFKAIRSFLKQDGCKLIADAASQYCKTKIQPEHIKNIDVFLEKHGAFYHPSRIELYVNDQRIRFVLNVATSLSGKNGMEREYNTLQRLNNNFAMSFLPAVYGYGTVGDNNSGDAIYMFLGEWLEGYNEFHISKDLKNNRNQICVWDSESDHFVLSDQQATELYSHAAMILTYYYNLETCEQIFPWHHGAGDFVVSQKNGKISVKLITARQYTSMVEKTDTVDDAKFDMDSALEALLLFFLNLSIRMRIDRLDGTGAIVWSDAMAVKGMVKGFKQALALKSFPGNNACPVDICFQEYISSFSKENILSLIHEIIDTYNPFSSDVHVITQNVNEHAETVCNAIYQTG